MSERRARNVLDAYLFGNLANHYVYDEDNWEITYYGDHFLVHNIPNDQWHQFEVVMRPSDHDFSQDILDQEWCEDDDGNITVGTYAQPSPKKTWAKKHTESSFFEDNASTYKKFVYGR